VSVAACDVIFTGDSLGLHMGISQKVWMIPWFGPTCAHEIDLFERGEALVTSASCSPCWRQQCFQVVMCYDQVPVDEICGALGRYLERSYGDLCQSSVLEK
jgi:heptosyltransferase-2